MATPLDAHEINLRNAIKRVAEKFNEINRDFREFKNLLIQDKRVIMVVSRNFSSNPQRYSHQEFANLVNGKIEDLIKRFLIANSHLNTLREELNFVKSSLRSIHQYASQDQALASLIAQFGVILSESESKIEELSELFSPVEESLRRFIPQFISIGEHSQRVDVMEASFDNVYNFVDQSHLSIQNCMTTILSYYRAQFKIYKRSRG